MAGASICLAGQLSGIAVYTIEDIGPNGSSLSGTVKGTLVSAGDANLHGVSIDPAAAGGSYCLLAGGSASLSGSYKGDIVASGDMTLGGISVSGSAVSGAAVNTVSGGMVGGNLISQQPSSIAKNFTVKGDILQQSYVPVVNYNMYTDYFKSLSDEIAAMQVNTVFTSERNKISIDAVSGVNVVSIDAQTLENANSIIITGNADSVVYINVIGDTVELSLSSLSYAGGITMNQVLLNMNLASELTLSGSNRINILATNADADFNGHYEGSLVVNSLQGRGSIFTNSFDYEKYAPIPEPATMAILALGAGILLKSKRAIKAGR